MNSTKVQLPYFLKPRGIDGLIRLGKDFDGGYLIDERCLQHTDTLVSMGVRDDWSFEEAFTKINDVEVYAFDGTMDKSEFFRNGFKAIALLGPMKSIKHWFGTYKSYKRFFTGKRKHIQRNIGIANHSKFLSMEEVLEQYTSRAKEPNVFLKVDIEGWEYRILDDLVKHADRISGFAVEFHDLDLHLDRLEDFIKNFKLDLVHVHCNNAAPIINGIPTVIECTFSPYSTNGPIDHDLPHPELDMPGKPTVPDFDITFST